MFIVYKSNQLDILLSKVYKIIEEKPLPNIFEKEIFIHDNKILFQYLNIFIANKIGISINFKLYHPDDFIWKLLQKTLLQKNNKNIFTSSILTWKIMTILNKNNFHCFHKTKDKLKQLKFAALMANIFKQYIFYRPNWINEWEIEKKIPKINITDQWQIKLWIKIIHNYIKNNQFNNHYARLFYNFQLLDNEKKIKKKIPTRFFIISSFKLNLSYIQILKKISSYIDVYFLYITPFKNNVFNRIYSNQNVQEITKKNNILTDSLIKIWGQYEKIYTFYINECKKIKIINCFKKSQKNNLLNNIKNDFIKNNTSTIDKMKKRTLNLTDHSISINICYDKRSEIKILHKTLLQLLNRNSKIKISDIVVVSFSIDTYISYINSIFTSVNKKTNIPFFISKKFSKEIEIVFSSFNKILNLHNSRFENQEILEFLYIPEIAKNFNILEEEIKILYNWIEETNIRWAINSKHKESLSFPKNNQNTWFDGIEKLLLSYALNEPKKNWKNIVSSSFIDNSRSDLVGKLIIFIQTLKKWQKRLSKSQNLTYWRSLAKKLINDFFYINEKIEKPIQIIQKNWIEMIDDGLLSNYTEKISINILQKKFLYKHENTKNQKFLPGVVNFCHPSLICYIPFKIIYIIGLDNQNIPKKYNLNSFNLLNKYPLIGDINIYEQYCYLFLQIISCTKKYFYISYSKYSIKNESKVSPSFLIDQLLNYIALNFCFIGDEDLTIENNTKKIIKHICKKYRKEQFYDKKTIDVSIKNIQNTYKNIDFKIHNRNLYHQSSFKKKFFNKINLLDLINFWKNPIRYFINFNFKIKFDLKKQKIDTTEPFSINRLDFFKINNIILNKIINNEDITELFQYYKLSGKLPYNFFGKICWNQNIKKMQEIANLIMKYRISRKEKKVNLKVQKYQVHGTLSGIETTGLLRWKPNKINYSDRISLWLEHLIYSILGGIGESKIIGYKNQIWSFSSLNTDIAYNYLLKYINGYIEGIKKPLFLIKSGASWLDQVYDIKNNIIKYDNITKKKGYKKLLETWEGNDYNEGEKNDLYVQQIITNLEKNNIKKICQIAKKWLIPILKNKKIS